MSDPAPATKPVSTKRETKLVGLPVLKITKLVTDCLVDIENGNGTTIIKLDKYRIEVPSAVKISIK